MSSEDARLAEAVLEAINRHDADALLAMVHPDYEFHSRFAGVEGKAYRGPNGFVEYFQDLHDGFVDANWELIEVVGRNGDDLVVVFRFRARGRESGVPIDLVTPMVWTLPDGSFRRNVIYRTVEEACAAAGLAAREA